MNDKIEGMYLHCRQCIEAQRPTSYEICCNGKHVQVWCRTCDIEVATLELKPDTIRIGECEGEHHG